MEALKILISMVDGKSLIIFKDGKETKFRSEEELSIINNGPHKFAS